MTQDHRPRSETRRMIIDIIAQSEEPLTRTEIVNGINRKKTPHLIDMIEALVDEGIFARQVVFFHNGVKGYVYSLAKEYVRE